MSNVGNPEDFPVVFDVEKIAHAKKPTQHGLDTMVDPLMQTVVKMLHLGCHKDMITKQWRIYDPRVGLWKVVDIEYIRFVASVFQNKSNNVDRGKMKMIPRKYMDDFWFQIVYDHPVGMEWEVNADNYHSMIPFKNRVLDLETRNELKYHKELYLESKIERLYEPNAGVECPSWLGLIEHLADGDPYVMEVLEAFAFLSITGRGRLERCILSMYSELGGSGKGTYMNALTGLVGANRATSMEISRLCDDTLLSYVDGKTLITFPEEREVLRSSTNAFARILKLASLDPIRGRVVHSPQEFVIQPRAMMVFASNYHVFPSDGAGARRVLMLRTYQFPDEERDEMLGLKIEDEYARITNRLLEKFDWDPGKAAKVIKDAASYEVFVKNSKENAKETSSVAAFISEMVIPICPIHCDRDITVSEYKENNAYKGSIPPAISVASLYAAYKNYLEVNNPGARPLRRNKFEREFFNYFKIQLKHTLIAERGAVPGLIGSILRFVGIMPNPDTWIEEYKMWRP